MTRPSKVFAREATGLVRQLSAFDALGMSLSAMGLLFAFNVIVFSPAFYPDANPIAIALFGLLLSLPSVGVYTLMSIAMPRTGGDYVWVSRITHPSAGFSINLALTLIPLAFVGIGTPTAVQWATAEMFYDLGKIYNNQNYISIATYLQGSDPTFWIAIVLIFVAAAIVMANVKLATAIVRYFSILAFIIAVVFVATVLAAGNSTFIANFNALSGANYNDVITAGQTAGAYNGAPSMFSFSSLYAGAATGALAYLGFYYPVYFAGEVKQVRRTQIIAQVGGIIIFAIFTSIIVAVEYFGEGPSFANAMAALWASGSSSFPYISIPLASGMSMFWTQNPFLVVLFNLSYAGTIEIFNIVVFFTLARNLFAWSFDRITPTAFASLNDRTHTPVNATIPMVLVSIVYTYVAVYQYGILASYFSYGTAGLVIGIALVALAAMVYPFRRRDIFETTDPISKKKIMGVPLITIFGALTIISSVIIVYAIILPVIGGIEFVTILTQGIIPTFVIGIVLYAIAWAVRKRQGLDLGLIQREIPPE